MTDTRKPAVPETPAWAKDGAPIWYHPHSMKGSPRYAGRIAGTVFDLGGTPCVRLDDMEPVYGVQKRNDPSRTTVPAAALHCVEPRAEAPQPDSQPAEPKRRMVIGRGPNALQTLAALALGEPAPTAEPPKPHLPEEPCFYCEGEQFDGHECEHCGRVHRWPQPAKKRAMDPKEKA